jgi:transketolase
MKKIAIVLVLFLFFTTLVSAQTTTQILEQNKQLQNQLKSYDNKKFTETLTSSEEFKNTLEKMKSECPSAYAELKRCMKSKFSEKGFKRDDFTFHRFVFEEAYSRGLIKLGTYDVIGESYMYTF